MLKIAWILPVGTKAFNDRISGLIKKIKRPDVEPEVTNLSSKLPTDLEYHFYEHLVLGDLLRKIAEYEQRNFSAAVIGCFYDGGLREARELVRMPVIGEGESTMHLAASLGHRFSIIAGRRKWIPKFEDNARVYGLEGKLASCREVGYSIKRISTDRAGYLRAVKKVAKLAIQLDRAEVLALSEEASFDLEEIPSLQRDLGVPILDPGVVAWKFAEMIADMYQTMEISHSKIAEYESPKRPYKF